MIDKYDDRINLSTHVLKSYKRTLDNPDYINHQDGIAKRTLAWHARTESLLQKSVTFSDLWPTMATILHENTHEN
jgi:hypothetical protein